MSMANLKIDPVSRYRVLRQLGQTQLTRIYLVALREASPNLGLLSLELLRPDLVRDAELRASFLEQAADARDLDHPNLVRTREVVSDCVLSGAGVSASGAPSVLPAGGYGRTTEWLDGQPFSRLLERVGRADFPLPLHVRILCQVLAGLEFAHGLGKRPAWGGTLVHRDISPDNVFITYDGQVRLLGAGFARTLEALEQRLGHLLTDFGYAAPELCLGYPATPSGDVYAAGVMLWEALARMRRTFASSVADCLRLRTNGEEPGIEELYPDVPERLARICRRALAVSPRDRYPDAAEMRIDLESYLSDTRPEAEQRAGLGPLAELMDQHFAPERSEMLLFIGSQWSEAEGSEAEGSEAERAEAERAGTRPGSEASAGSAAHRQGGALDEDAEDTRINSLPPSEPFTATSWDDHTHTVTGFEDLAAPQSSPAAPSSARAPRTGSVSAAAEPSAACAPSDTPSSVRLGEAARALAAAAARAEKAEGPPGVGPAPVAAGVPSAVPRRPLALTEPIDPALVVAMQRRHAARAARRGEARWAELQLSRLRTLVVSVSPFSRTVLGIALGVVLLAVVTRKARPARDVPALAEAPLAVPSPSAHDPLPAQSSSSGSELLAAGSLRAPHPAAAAPADPAASADPAAPPDPGAPEPRLVPGAPAAVEAAAAEPVPGSAAAGHAGASEPELSSEPATASPAPGAEGASGDGAPSIAASSDTLGDAVYLRSEDVEHLREVSDVSPRGPRATAGARAARAARAKARDDSPEPGPQPASPEPLLIDETDPYSP